MLGYKAHDAGALKLAAFDTQRRDHFVIGLGHVTRTGRYSNLGIMHLYAVLVDIRDLKPLAIQGVRD